MAKKELVTKVWIEEGCIVCDACETAAPDVFEVLEDTCIVRPAALAVEFTKPRSEGIVDAAEECPTDVIKFETVTIDAPDDEAAPAAAEAASEKGAEEKEAQTAKAGADVSEKDQAVGKKTKAVPAAAHDEVSKPPAGAKAKPKEKAGAATGAAPEPAIQALLKAATGRGGNAGLRRRSESVPESVEALRRKDPSKLPPDARQARILEAAGKMDKSPDLQRRSMIGGTALAVGWTAFGVGTALSVGPVMGRFMMPNVLEEPDPRVRVGKLRQYIEMAPGGVNEDYKPLGIWMIREEARIAALNIICTHLGCIPNWLPNDRKFKCPCHGSGFKPDGINFEGPTPRPLERFRIYIEDGLVVVDKGKKYQYELGQWVMPGSYLEV